MRHRFNQWSCTVLVAFAALILVLPAQAQVSTATISGRIVDATGPVPGARVVATNVSSGFSRDTTAGVDGSFRLGGLQPGTYTITVSAEAYREQSQTLQVLLGQESNANFRLAVDAVYAETVTVVGEGTQVLMDTRSPEISTNITQQQIESLPLNNRNFLAFAGLAPGVSFTRDTDGAGQTFTSGAQDAKQVNVFIDGVSYKNDIIKGGAFMQDSSRGNPFPQSAVQEYQVLTQNYKAEYEKATAAVITAVTKSGGNDLSGDVFWFFQDQGLVEQDDFARERGDEKVPFERNQYGLSVGGPILRDRLHFFLSGERNERDRVASVFVGPEWDQAPANVRDFLDDFATGSVAAPFESTLFFAKLSFQPAANQSAEFSYHRRDEDEIRGFGGQRVQQGGENILIGTDAATLRHQFVFGANALNEATVTYQDMSWAQTATDINSPNLNYVNLLNVGGISYIQELAQQRIGIRDDLSFYISRAGSHTLKAGVVASTVNYDFTKSAFLNPVFEFRRDENWQFPFLARVGAGNPSLDFGNNQYGFYVQDDWRMGSLTVSGGVRWDYETNMLNNNWVTPPAVAQGLRTACRTYSQPVGGRTEWCVRDLFDVEEYISDGSNRESPTDLFQPRLGASYDVGGTGRTVVFGGWGIYYDRVTLNDIYDEAYRHQWGQYTICFKQGGVVPANCPATAIEWDPAYLNPGALSQLAQSGAIGNPEVFLLSNDTGVPQSTQWTVGVRQQIGRNWLGALTYANSRSENGLVWSFASVPPGANFDDRWGSWISIPGYGFMMRSYDDRKREYDGLYLTLDRPRTAGSRWGLNFAYTYSEGFQNASLDDGTAFAFDFLPPDFPMFPANGDERHRVMLSGSIGLPLNFEASSIIQLGSGTPVSYAEALTGPFHFHPNGARPAKQSFLGIDEFSYRSVDLRLQWSAPTFSGVRLSLIGEAFNIFDFDNYSGFDTWGGGLNAPNPNFMTPNSEFNSRRFQLGARVAF
ncbi:MAG TPA: carboxypeptidase regulatory-like domain-containing protein [Thermoanaerobaculia bacterium]|nr:carboxypeptidase regulatory-like domain-containing protein [Thermoanaerobaculia bacterium]